MILSIELVLGTSLLYILVLFMVAYYADKKQELGQSIISNPLIYSLSIGVYATTWTYYGSVGRAATTGIDFLLIYLGPTLTTFFWWFVLRKIIRISKENNITSIADFISSRYGKSQALGALVTIIAIVGIMPYIALQLKAVSSSFDIICGYPYMQLPFIPGASPMSIHTSFLAALIFSLFGVIFGARNLISSERHEGLVAAIAVESVVKLLAFMVIGLFVTYGLFDGFGDIFTRMKAREATFDHLVTINENSVSAHMNWFSTLWLSMGAILLLPRQFHVAVIENSNEEHIKMAMWLFPAYMFLINLFVMPIAFGGILYSGGIFGADYFVINLPLQSGHAWLALLAFLGGFSAAASMVIVESVAISTMFLNHLLMPIVVRFKPRDWFPLLLINLKRLGIFLVIFLGYLYQRIVGETYMLVNIGLISFAAVIQFGPALFGGLFWRRGNKTGAITGIFLGFVLWFYTLLMPSLIRCGWWHSDILDKGPFGIELLKPTELFGLTGLDTLSHAFFWSMFVNIAGYLICSIIFSQGNREEDQARKFVDIFIPAPQNTQWETKRLTKPVAIQQFVNLLSKFIGEPQAVAAIREYRESRNMDEDGQVPEFELPKFKRFAERTLAGSVGAAAAGAIIESYLSDQGSRMESVYDVFSTVRTSLAESKENLSVRLRASEIMNRTLDLQIIMDDLLDLIRREFKFDLVIIRLQDEHGMLTVRSYQSSEFSCLTQKNLAPDRSTYAGESFLTQRVQVVNDTRNMSKPQSRELMESEEISCFAHIPIARAGEPPMGILSLFSKTLVGVFTEEFLNLLSSLAGQLAQAVTIVSEMEARERERLQKEQALLENARVARDMEIARQIQFSLLPSVLPDLPGVAFAGICIPAAHVGGDYYDFFLRGGQVIDIVIADVSGHSVGAALIMAETRSVLRARVYSAATAPDVLSLLNELLYEDLTNAELFITMFYVKYNVFSRMLSFASAGHNKPLLFRQGEVACIEIDAEGLILGVLKAVVFENKSILMLEGDILLLYTDGITEAQNPCGDFFGIDRLSEIVADNHAEHPQKIIDSVLESLTEFCQSRPLQDDISMVVLKVV
ncbi:MAG: SpoIIE family protein phosphatase [Deltaproteobacteria bacterium]|nr:SpoIIE family protein phosphatase [Deltaproteobacteria bacterium]